jgi:cytochrome P450
MNLNATHDSPTDPIAAVVHADPYPYYDSLRRGADLFYDERLKLWVAAKAATVEQVLADPSLRVRPLQEPVPRAIAGGSAGDVFARLVRMNEGEAAHAVPKLALREALSAVPLPEVAAQTRALARSMLPHDADALSAWTFELPVSVVASWLGFRDEQLPSVAQHVGRFVACLSPLSTVAQIDAAHSAAAALIESIKPLLADADAEASNQSLTAQVARQARAVGWTEADSLVANLLGLMSQTYDATAGLIGNAIVALLRHPERRRTMRPADIAAFIDEVARHDPAIHNTRRFAAEDLTIAGAQLKQGDAVLVLLAAANRDGDQQFGFGRARHACPGQAIATTIAVKAIEALLADQPSMLDTPLRWAYRASANARIPVFTQPGTPA